MPSAELLGLDMPIFLVEALTKSQFATSVSLSPLFGCVGGEYPIVL